MRTMTSPSRCCRLARCARAGTASGGGQAGMRAGVAVAENRAMPEIDLAHTERVHLVGIGGSGMSALARLLLEMGKHVSGSDATPGAVTRQLESAGAVIFEGHAAEH